MATLTYSTELEAVNTCMLTIGEAPVNSIDVDTVPVEVTIAKDTIRNVSREVQQKGWNFNTDENFTIARTVEGYIDLPLNVLRADLTYENGVVDMAQRGLRMYDRKNHTYIFTANYKFDVVWFLEWSEIPEVARRYITIKAARIFQSQVLGSETIHGFTSQEELSAWTAMLDAESQNADLNIFNDSTLNRAIRRGR